MGIGDGTVRDVLGIIGIVALILSYLHFFRPNIVHKIDELGRKVVINMSQLSESYRVLLGMFYFIVGLALVYIGFLWGR